VTRKPPEVSEEAGAAPYVPDTDDLVALAREGAERFPRDG